MRCCAGDEGFVALRGRPAEGGFKPVGADNVVTTVDLVLSCRATEGEVRYSAAGEPGNPAPSVPMSLRFTYLVVLRVFGWLALGCTSDLYCAVRRCWSEWR